MFTITLDDDAHEYFIDIVGRLVQDRQLCLRINGADHEALRVEPDADEQYGAIVVRTWDEENGGGKGEEFRIGLLDIVTIHVH
jgi:hypothetical protein